MAHYAFLDSNNIVTEVIVGKNENEDGGDWEKKYSEIRGQPCKRTSYNTFGGIHYNPETNRPSDDQSKAFRKNYAGIGFTYDKLRDAFIPPKPFASWVFNESTCLWESPVSKPNDEGTGDPPKIYEWDEITKTWMLWNRQL